MPFSSGSPIEIDFGAGADPANIPLDVPEGAVSFTLMCGHYISGFASQVVSCTLGGNAPNNTSQVNTGSSPGDVAMYVAEWTANLPATGSRDLDIQFSFAPTDGPAAFGFFLDDVGAVIGLDTANVAGGAATSNVSATVAGTGASDEVYAMEVYYDASTPPALASGWTSEGTGGQGTMQIRLQSENSPSSGSTFDSQEDYYSAVGAIAFEAGAASGRILAVPSINPQLRNLLIR